MSSYETLAVPLNLFHDYFFFLIYEGMIDPLSDVMGLRTLGLA